MKSMKLASLFLTASILLLSSVSFGGDKPPPGKEPITVVMEMKNSFVHSATLEIAAVQMDAVSVTYLPTEGVTSYTDGPGKVKVTMACVSSNNKGIKRQRCNTYKNDRLNTFWVTGYSMAGMRVV